MKMVIICKYLFINKNEKKIFIYIYKIKKEIKYIYYFFCLLKLPKFPHQPKRNI